MNIKGKRDPIPGYTGCTAFKPDDDIMYSQ